MKKTIGLTSLLATLAIAVAPTHHAEAADTWTGFHAGVNLGYGRLDTTWADTDYYNYSYSYDLTGQGIVGGLQGGYDHQFGSLVLGAELDFSFSTIEEEQYNGYWPTTFTASVDWFASLRGRGGIAVDSSLIYLTAGMAIVEQTNEVGDGWYGEWENNGLGFVFGGGLEHRLDANWSVRAEILYFSLPSARSDAYSGSYTLKSESELTVFRMGAGYRF